MSAVLSGFPRLHIARCAEDSAHYAKIWRICASRRPVFLSVLSVPSVVPLPVPFFTKAEVVAENGLERFFFAMFKVTNAGQVH